MNSFDMQLHLEAERLIEEKVDKLHKKGYKDRKGSSDRFKILDSSHRKDQVDQTVQLLKQRNVKE